MWQLSQTKTLRRCLKATIIKILPKTGMPFYLSGSPGPVFERFRVFSRVEPSATRLFLTVSIQVWRESSPEYRRVLCLGIVKGVVILRERADKEADRVLVSLLSSYLSIF